MEKKTEQSGHRKRGRPVGKQRVPLTLDERRARGAKLERERRVELSKAKAELCAAAGCGASISSSLLLATVITGLQRAAQTDHNREMDRLRRENEYYLAQIADLEQRIAESDDRNQLSPRQNQTVQPGPGGVKRKRSSSQSSDEKTVLQTPVSKSSPEPEYSSPSSNSSQPPSPPEQELKQPPAPVIPQHHGYFKQESKFEPSDGHSIDPRFPSQYSVSNVLPETKLSPLSDTTDRQTPENSALDYSQYRFAGAHISTPEYRIVSGPLEFVPIASPSPQEPTSYEEQPLSEQYNSAPSPPQFVVPVTNYEQFPVFSPTDNQFWVQQSMYTVPVEYSGQQSVEAEAPPALVDVAGPSGISEPSDLAFMSYDQMIALYL